MNDLSGPVYCNRWFHHVLLFTVSSINPAEKGSKGVKSLIDSCLLIKGSVIGYQHKTNPFERILDTGALAFSSKYFGASPTTLHEAPQFHKNEDKNPNLT